MISFSFVQQHSLASGYNSVKANFRKTMRLSGLNRLLLFYYSNLNSLYSKASTQTYAGLFLISWLTKSIKKKNWHRDLVFMACSRACSWCPGRADWWFYTGSRSWRSTTIGQILYFLRSVVDLNNVQLPTVLSAVRVEDSFFLIRFWTLSVSVVVKGPRAAWSMGKRHEAKNVEPAS